MRKFGSVNLRRILYMLCFGMFCLIDQRIKTCSGLDGWLETFRDLMGVVMAVIIISHYRISDFKPYKAVYLTWNAVALIGGLALLRFGQQVAAVFGNAFLYYTNDRIAIIIGMLLFGNIVIHTFIDVVIRKKMPNLNRKFLFPWLLMMILMIGSRSTYVWPFTHLVMFGCFYLMNFTEEEREDLLQGMLDGVIMAFFLMQGWCFVFRPYDVARYVGVYSNCNLNAFFYLEVLTAVFSKLLYLADRYDAQDGQAPKWLTFVKLFYWLGAGALYAFLFMTIGRTAWLVSFVLGLIFLGALKRIQRKKRFLIHGIALILCMFLTFPLVFGAVRYLPPVFHHPVWFFGEWDNQKVHSWDKWDSEKFIDLDEFLETALGRVTEEIERLFAYSPFKLTAEASAAETFTVEERYAQMLEQGYALTFENATDSFLVRKNIYRYYLDHLNLTGHPYKEQGFQMLPDYWIGHAHNIYLQWGTDFGVPAMLLLVGLTIGTIIGFTVRFLRRNSLKTIVFLMFFLVTMSFGLLEYSWGVGSLGITMMFITWREMCTDEKC